MCVAVSYGVMQCVAVCCSVLQSMWRPSRMKHSSVLQCVLQCVLQDLLQCVAVCCSVLQCVVIYLAPLSHEIQQCVAVCCKVCYRVCCTVYCSVLQSVAVCCSVMQYFAVCCSVLQCVAVCCSVLQCVAVCCSMLMCVAVCLSVLHCVAVCCNVLQCAVVRCSVLQCVAVCCSVAASAKKESKRATCCTEDVCPLSHTLARSPALSLSFLFPLSVSRALSLALICSSAGVCRLCRMDYSRVQRCRRRGPANISAGRAGGCVFRAAGGATPALPVTMKR